MTSRIDMQEMKKMKTPNTYPKTVPFIVLMLNVVMIHQQTHAGDGADLHTSAAPFDAAIDSGGDQPPIGTLWILSAASYSTGGTLTKPMTIGAPLGATLTR